jgi:hypothetical protein
MDKRWFFLVAIVVIAAFWWVISNNRTDSVQYRGETIKLSKSYTNFDQYKNDPNNIAPSETARVQTLVTTAPIAHSFRSQLDVFKATQDIVFPGYGSGVTGGGSGPDGIELFAVTVEIPRANKYRYFVFRGANGQYELLDDFVHDDTPYPFGIREEDGSYVFLDRAGLELFRRPATPHRGG